MPRLSRLLVADGRAEVKEHAVAALNRVANAARGEALDGELMSGPVALARLAASDRPDCSSEGAWALHVLSTKGGDKIAAKMARTPEVMAILEKRAVWKGDRGRRPRRWRKGAQNLNLRVSATPVQMDHNPVVLFTIDRLHKGAGRHGEEPQTGG